MPKTNAPVGQTCLEAFQIALDSADMIGHWSWDPATDRVRVDALVALLFKVDPIEAEAGIPLAIYEGAIHADDRARVVGVDRRSVAAGNSYIAEYRVISVDGRTRWILARGRFTRLSAGRPKGGRGILADITGLRARAETGGATAPVIGETALDRAVEHALAAQDAVAALGDPALKAEADALLLALGRHLARRQVAERRRLLN
ncbi:PAS domain-containing protein [Methylobacterium mesophilicum]|uniref:PAS domain-containing protein n=1 Tax=Methylobacterium mesophilicum TaxID=39956 RepID=UPI002F33E38E